MLEYLNDGDVALAYNERSRTFDAVDDGSAEGFIAADNGTTVPAASRLSLLAAWLFVRAFLEDPSVRPTAEWIDANELAWREDF